MITIELATVLAALTVGIRLGGVGIGAGSAFGILVLVWCFHLPASGPPVDVIFIVLSIITASSTLQASGGVELLVHWASRVLWKRPSAITLVAPLVAYIFTFLAGTGYVAYALLPVISEVSVVAGVRPEKPLSISVIASQMAITASPVSAATAAFIGLLNSNHSHLGLLDIMLVCVPATILGTLLGAASVFWRGRNLDQTTKPANRQNDSSGKENTGERSKMAAAIFFAAVVIIVFLGVNPNLRLISRHGSVLQRIEMAPVIQIVMLSATGIMILCCKCKVEDITKTPIMRAGISAVLSIYGVAWLGNCFFEGNKPQIVGALTNIVSVYPSTFAVALFAMSALVYSQAATVAALMYLGFFLKLPHPLLIAMFPAVNGFFFFPTSGTVVAAVAFDPTGSTRIGKFVLNHSFMLPGIVALTGSVFAGILITNIFY